MLVTFVQMIQRWELKKYPVMNYCEPDTVNLPPLYRYCYFHFTEAYDVAGSLLDTFLNKLLFIQSAMSPIIDNK